MRLVLHDVSGLRNLQVEWTDAEFERSPTVSDLKCFLKSEYQFDYEFRLIFGGQNLHPEEEPLNKFGMHIPEVPTIHLVPTSPQPHSPSNRSSAHSNRIKVKELSPNRGTTFGGEKVTIKGMCFDASRSVACKFGGIVVGAIRKDEWTIECFAPPHTPGPVAVEVSCGGEFTNDEVIYEYFLNQSVDSDILVKANVANLDSCRILNPVPLFNDSEKGGGK